MAQGVVALNQGFDYQARFFWIQASRLFMPSTKVIRVGFEVDRARGFDDVAAYYDGAVDELFAPLRSDHFSVKFHVDHSDGITYESLIDPAFINATSESLLQKLHRVQQQYAPDGTGARFFLVSPWRPSPSDALGQLVETATGALKIDRRFGDKNKRLLGTVRRAWMNHLELLDEEELRIVLRPLRFNFAFGTMTDMTGAMSRDLREAGFRAVEALADDAIRQTPYKFAGGRRSEFARDELVALARTNSIWVGRTGPKPSRPTRAVAVRSFVRGVERLHEQVADYACVSHLFDDRQLFRTSGTGTIRSDPRLSGSPRA